MHSHTYVSSYVSKRQNCCTYDIAINPPQKWNILQRCKYKVSGTFSGSTRTRSAKTYRRTDRYFMMVVVREKLPSFASSKRGSKA